MLSAENAPTFQPSNNSSNRNRNTHRFSYKDANNALLIPPSDSEFIFPTLKVDSLALYFAQKPEFVSSIYYEACYDLESESDSTKSYKMSKNTTSPSIPKSPTVTTPSNPTLPKSSTHRKVSILTQLGRFALYLIFTLTLLFTIYLASPTKKGPAGKKKQPKEYLDEIAFYKTRVELALNICLVLGAVGAIGTYIVFRS